LERLREEQVKATFFVLGRRADCNPEVVAALRAEGHELGCHSFGHLNAWKVTPARAWADIEKGYCRLESWVGADAMFRPPYGKVTPLVLRKLRRRGVVTALWTHDSKDTTHGLLPSTRDVVRRVLNDEGGVVLLHDFDRTGPGVYADERAAYVLDITSKLIAAGRAEGLRMMTLGSLLASAHDNASGRRN
jgi:peptidoglycan/xylan/chitin deacetylase (PgdA/CDA1 family)